MRLTILLACVWLAGISVAAEKKKITIGWTAWADAEVVTHLAKRVLEDELNYDVKLTMTDIGIQYQGIVNGDLDAMLMAWLPTTHKNYFTKFATDVVNLGPLYLGARLGWIVPDYIPASELDSITDLKKDAVRTKLRSKIYGIDPGSGLMQASEKAMDHYELARYTLISSSGAARTAALARAIRRKKWIVATGWSPHWLFSQYKLRYLKDPDGILGGSERVHALTRKGLEADHPEAVAFLTRMYIPLPDLEKAMLQASQQSVEQAVEAYIKGHPKQIQYWAHGRF
jgi:glycine betaine/proline transport system substrate-binding protein